MIYLGIPSISDTKLCGFLACLMRMGRDIRNTQCAMKTMLHLHLKCLRIFKISVMRFLAATKHLYDWFSPSVHLSVRPSHFFSPCSHHHVIMKFSGVITMDRSDVHAKGQDHTALKIVEFDPDWAFPDCNSSLNSPMATKWCTKVEVA